MPKEKRKPRELTEEEKNNMTPEEKGKYICKCLDINLFAKILLDSQRRKAEKARAALIMENKSHITTKDIIERMEQMDEEQKKKDQYKYGRSKKK